MDHHRADHPESSSTLLWMQLEFWMEEDYLWRACELMKWQPIAIRIPRLPPMPATSQQPNNPGYCYLVFRSPTQAAAALAQVSNGRETAPVMMPFSSSPYVLCWAPMPPYTMNPTNSKPDYSIFIADLSPHATEDDILRVFRNPKSGQSPHREPQNIPPFKDCTSVKLMRDNNGNSCHSAFVRFQSPEERNRALRDAPGLLVLGRPIRVCPATDPKSSQSSFPGISSQIVPANSNSSLGSSSTHGPSSLSSSSSGGSLPDLSSVDPELVRLAISLMQNNNNIRNGKYRSQSRSLSGDLAGPKGEWLASTDPNNTTVFVGGLTPDITEEILWNLFYPFGPIYYVKVVENKNCGFVQYVLKSDAARAIAKMQNYPVNRTHIRLAWGHSTVQAAAAAGNTQVSSSSSNPWTLEQLLVLLQELDNLGFIQPALIPPRVIDRSPAAPNYSTNRGDNTLATNQHLMTSGGSITPDGGNKSRNDNSPSDDILRRPGTFLESTETYFWPDTRCPQSSFTPFSPNSSLVMLEDATPPKAARDLSPLYNGNSTSLLGTESSNASYSVPYLRARKEIDRAVSRPDSKSSLDGQAEADNLSATFASLDMNNERNHQQRQG